MFKTILKILSLCFFCFSCGSITNNSNMQNDNEGLLVTRNNDEDILLQVCDSNLKNNGDKSEEYVKYSLVKKDDSIEYEINRKNLDPPLKRYFEIKNSRNDRIKERIERKFGKDEIRAHWDLGFRRKDQENRLTEDITYIFENNENETLTLKKGSLRIKDWLRIENQEVIQNLDPLYLNEDDNWPRKYVRKLKHNKCKRSGLLTLSRVCGSFLLVGSIGLEVFFIFKTETDMDFYLYAILWGIEGVPICGIGSSLFLFDPFSVYVGGCIKYSSNIKDSQIQIKEPGKCRKVACCMKPKENPPIPGTYRCLGCFSYPDCMYSCLDSISRCFDKMASCFTKDICCIDLNPEEIVLNIRKDKISDGEYTIDLKVGEATDL